MKTKIVSEVKGGNIQCIASNSDDIKIVIIDHDQAELGETERFISEPLSPDSVTEDLHTLYTDSGNPRDIEIRDRLKHMKM